jgi:hypothetical protein
MAEHFQRPDKDFTCQYVKWTIDIAKNHTNAGFAEVPRAAIIQHHWVLLDFLQSNQLTKHVVSPSLESITDETKLTNFDLTEDGYYFLQNYLQKHSGRLYKRDSLEKSRSFLEKWFVDFKKKKSEA